MNNALCLVSFSDQSLTCGHSEKYGFESSCFFYLNLPPRIDLTYRPFNPPTSRARLNLPYSLWRLGAGPPLVSESLPIFAQIIWLSQGIGLKPPELLADSHGPP